MSFHSDSSFYMQESCGNVEGEDHCFNSGLTLDAGPLWAVQPVNISRCS